MITTFVFLLLLSGAFCLEDIESKCVQDGDCFVLQKEFVRHINPLVSPCQDIYSYSCTKNTYSRRKPLGHRLSEMRVYLDELLNSSANNEDSELLAVEKKLYRSCTKLVSLDNERSQNGVQHITSYFENMRIMHNWEDVENQLYSLGFGFSFFDMKVIPHPEYESRNTILLQPPSLEKLNSLIFKVQKFIDLTNVDEGRLLLSERQARDTLYYFMDKLTAKNVQRLFESLKQAKFGLLAHKAKFPEYYTTVGHLKGKSWVKVIKDMLEKENIEFNTIDIVLKNPQYFEHLGELLQNTARHTLVSAVLTKAVTESLPYVNWKAANSLENIYKQEFCMKETKLYGASHKLVRDYLTDFNKDKFSNLEKSENIYEKIVETLRSEIELYYSDPSFKALYYSRKLTHVRDSLKKYVYERPYNFYENLDISSKSHWKNILEYRKLLAGNDLKMLQNNFDYARPFSFIDQDEPQNRYIINTISNILDMHSPNSPKEMHYGTFGVRTAGLIHSLLQEDTYNIDHDLMSFNSRGLTYPEYSESIEYCIGGRLELSNSVDQADQDSIITQVLALNTAHKALQLDEIIEHQSTSHVYLSRNLNRINQSSLFLTAFVIDNCGLGRNVIDRILSYNPLLHKAFTCDKKDMHEYGITCMLGLINR